jgi:hypothetical protein
MPKFLDGCHYNEEEINGYLKKKRGYWPVQINGNKFATGQILGKPVEVVKGRILGFRVYGHNVPFILGLP